MRYDRAPKKDQQADKKATHVQQLQYLHTYLPT